jgi:hypothetical protein
LGPLLFLVHVGDMQEYLGIGKDYNVVYVDDTCLWCYATSLPAAVAKLNSLAIRFSAFARESGLALNAGKTQLLFSAGSGNVNAAAVTVDGKKIVAKDTIEFLGVKFDRRFGTAKHEKALVAAVRQRASVIKRISNHLPRGENIRQLSTGLVVGKMSCALLAVYTPSLAATTGTEATKANAAYKAVQVAMNNVARSVTPSPTPWGSGQWQ